MRALLLPHIIALVIPFVLREYLSGHIQIPTLPLDYFALQQYEKRHTASVTELVKKWKNGTLLTESEMSILFDQALCAEFLVQIPFSIDEQ